METLTIGNIITTGFQRGLKNIVPVLTNTVLWIVTIWIPYLNVGTTIGIIAGVIPKMSRDEEIPMTEVFNPDYRKKMGEFFLVQGFMMAGIIVGMVFLYVPGIVIMIAWLLAPFLVVDKDMNPIEAIKKSNDLTYGKKWVIFLGLVVLAVICQIAVGIVLLILSKILTLIPVLGPILLVVCVVAAMGLYGSVMMSALSYIYGELTS